MIITGDNKETTKATKLNPGVINQISNVVNSNKSEIETVTQEASEEIEIQTESKATSKKTAEKKENKTEKKRNYSDTVILNLPEGERNEFKAFCARFGITMTDYIYFAMDYIRNGVEEKKFSLSRSGIRELPND